MGEAVSELILLLLLQGLLRKKRGNRAREG